MTASSSLRGEQKSGHNVRLSGTYSEGAHYGEGPPSKLGELLSHAINDQLVMLRKEQQALCDHAYAMPRCGSSWSKQCKGDLGLSSELAGRSELQGFIAHCCSCCRHLSRGTQRQWSHLLVALKHCPLWLSCLIELALPTTTPMALKGDLNWATSHSMQRIEPTAGSVCHGGGSAFSIAAKSISVLCCLMQPSRSRCSCHQLSCRRTRLCAPRRR